MSKKIVILKLVTTENLIGEVEYTGSETIGIKNPIICIFSAQFGFIYNRYSPFSNSKNNLVQIEKNSIVSHEDALEVVQELYENMLKVLYSDKEDEIIKGHYDNYVKTVRQEYEEINNPSDFVPEGGLPN